MGICRFRQNFLVKCPCSETFKLCEIKQQQKPKTKNKKQKTKNKKAKKEKKKKKLINWAFLLYIYIYIARPSKHDHLFYCRNLRILFFFG